MSDLRNLVSRPSGTSQSMNPAAILSALDQAGMPSVLGPLNPNFSVSPPNADRGVISFWQQVARRIGGPGGGVNRLPELEAVASHESLLMPTISETEVGAEGNSSLDSPQTMDFTNVVQAVNQQTTIDAVSALLSTSSRTSITRAPSNGDRAVGGDFLADDRRTGEGHVPNDVDRTRSTFGDIEFRLPECTKYTWCRLYLGAIDLEGCHGTENRIIILPTQKRGARAAGWGFDNGGHIVNKGGGDPESNYYVDSPSLTSTLGSPSYWEGKGYRRVHIMYTVLVYICCEDKFVTSSGWTVDDDLFFACSPPAFKNVYVGHRGARTSVTEKEATDTFSAAIGITPAQWCAKSGATLEVLRSLGILA